VIISNDLPRAEVQQLMELLDEEVGELRKALQEADLVGIADGLGDVVYVAYGAALQYGIDLDVVIRAIHDANMTKADADEVTLREKVPRGESYIPPALEDKLRDMYFDFRDDPP
jgi:predicted HAD superfamily Cof-like phosphohydrolase